jgi:hypothetical protein
MVVMVFSTYKSHTFVVFFDCIIFGYFTNKRKNQEKNVTFIRHIYFYFINIILYFFSLLLPIFFSFCFKKFPSLPNYPRQCGGELSALGHMCFGHKCGGVVAGLVYLLLITNLTPSPPPPPWPDASTTHVLYCWGYAPQRALLFSTDVCTY